ncbi:MAG: DUF805 domain-containing protein [Clostridiales Family XIII bacterium]|nr:DUF805 domain-containing protein [Clostridiales Family XIII bacterium]
MSDEINKDQVTDSGAAAGGTPEQAPPQYEQAPPQYGQTPPQYGQTPPQYGQTPPQYGQNVYNQYYNEPMTGIVEAYKSYWKNYANFNDRTSRAGYWWVMLVNGIISIILYAILIVPAIAALSFETSYAAPFYAGPFVAMFAGAGIICFIWGLVNIIPQLAIIVRRLHDTGKSWVNILFGLIPFAGAIVVLVFMLIGTKYPPENRFYNVRKQA